MIDLDPQGNASTGLGIDRRQRKVSTYHVLAGEASLGQACIPTAVPRLMVAPSTMDLLGLELENGERAGPRPPPAQRASRASASWRHGGRHLRADRLPPSLNLLTINALAASDAVLVPLQCEFFALEG